MVKLFTLPPWVTRFFKLEDLVLRLSFNYYLWLYWIRQLDYSTSDQTPGPNDIKIQDYEPILFVYFNFIVSFLRALVIPFMKISYFKIFRRPKWSGIRYIPGIPSDSLLHHLWIVYRVFKLIYKGANLSAIMMASAQLMREIHYMLPEWAYYGILDRYGNHTTTQLLITLGLAPFLFWIFQKLVEKSDVFFRPLYDLLFDLTRGVLRRASIWNKKISNLFRVEKEDFLEEQVVISQKMNHNAVKITIFTLDYLNRRVFNMFITLDLFYRKLARVYLKL